MMTAGRSPGASQAPGTGLSGPTPQLLGASGVSSMMGLLNQSVSGSQNPPISINGSPPTPPSQPLPQSPHPQQVTSNTSIPGTHGFSDSLAGHSLAQPLRTNAAGQLPNAAGNEHHEQDVPGMKRRFESEEVDGKRAKLKTGEFSFLMWFTYVITLSER